MVFAGQQGVFPIDEILQLGITEAKAIKSITNAPTHHHEHHTDGNNSHKITTFTLSFLHPLDLNNLSLDLNRIVHLNRHQVYRVKGFIAIPNYPNRVILQSARSTFITTDGSAWEEGGLREGKLVFIGRDLKREVFEKMFNRNAVLN